jgi:osmotically inducible lipoprotein OsmB
MKPRFAIIAMATAPSVGGCANMTTTEQRMLSGAAIGTLGGAAIAAISSGSVATGAALGAGVGAGAGYLYSRTRNGMQRRIKWPITR